MQTEWCLVGRSRPKRSNQEGTGLSSKSSKRQRTLRSQLESSEECEDVPQIRGGLTRPRPQPLGPAPNRGRNTGSQANTKTPPSNQASQPRTPQSRISIVESDDEEDDEDWRRNLTPTNPPVQGTNTDQPGITGAGKGTGGTRGTRGNTGTTGTTGNNNTSRQPPNQPPKVGNTATPQQPQLPPFSEESEILQLYSRLQAMIVVWVEECLPDTFPPEFQTQKPESYNELCGWCRPVSLGNTMLQDRAWAKYVYESWVWRFLHQEVFRHDSLAWAGMHPETKTGPAVGVGGTVNAQLGSLFDPTKRLITPHQYESRIQQRAALVNQIRNGLFPPDISMAITGWLATEMLVAFHPFFSDVYKPIDNAQNIRALIVDTSLLVHKARELDMKLRSARRAYDLVLGREGDACRISGVPSPAIQRYVRAGNGSGAPQYLDDDSTISLIVVPGLVRLDITDSIYSDDDTLTRTVVRHARAFAQSDVLAAMGASYSA